LNIAVNTTLLKELIILKTHKISDSKVRNNEARKAITKVSEDHGVNFSFIAKMLGVSQSSFGHWKRGAYDYTIPNLKKVEQIIEKYTFEE